MESSVSQQRYKLDVETLLKTVTSLESQFAEQARQCTIPYWATDIFSRLLELETSNDKLQKKVAELVTERDEPLKDKQSTKVDRQSDAGAQGIGKSISPDIVAEMKTENAIVSKKQAPSGNSVLNTAPITSAALESKIMEKIRAEYENYVQTMKNAMDLKMTSLNIEIDRAYKLVQSRPTTTDFQHVIYQMQTLEEKMHDHLNEFSTSMKSSIQDNVSSEMENLVQQLKMNETINESNFKLVFEKFDNQIKDVEHIRHTFNGITEYCRKSIDELKMKSKLFDSSLEDNNSKIVQELNSMRDIIQDFHANQQAALESYSDMKATLARRLLSLEEGISALSAKSTESLAILDVKLTRLSEEHAHHINDIYPAFLLEVENDSKLLHSKILAIDEYIKELEDHGRSLDDEIDIITNNNLNIQNKLLSFDNHISFHSNRIDDMNSKLIKIELNNETKFRKLDIIEEKYEKLKTDSLLLTERVNDGSTRDDEMMNLIKGQDNIMKKVNDDISKLNLIWDETRALHEKCSSLGDRSNFIHNQLTMKLSELNHEFKENINEVKKKNAVRESHTNELIDELKENINFKFQQLDQQNSPKTINSNNEVKEVINTPTNRESIRKKIENLEILIYSIRDAPEDFFGSNIQIPFKNPSANNSSNNHHVHNKDDPSNNHSEHGNSKQTGPTHNNSLNGSNPFKPSVAYMNIANHIMSPTSAANANSNFNMNQNILKPAIMLRKQSSTFQNMNSDDANNSLQDSSSGSHKGNAIAMSHMPSESHIYHDVIDDAEIEARQFEELVKICMKYEDHCVQKSIIEEIPLESREIITNISKRQAAEIVAAIDLEVVQEALGKEDLYANIEELIANKRKERIVRILEEIKGPVVKRYPHPGIIRLDAREKFFKKLKTAIDMWLSKHDQVSYVDLDAV